MIIFGVIILVACILCVADTFRVDKTLELTAWNKAKCLHFNNEAERYRK